MQKNALTRLTSLYLCLMLTVFLLWPGTSGYAQIAEAKYRLFLWLTGGYCALSILLWSWPSFEGRRRSRGQALRSGCCWPICSVR